MSKEMTFEQIEAHVKQFNPSEFQEGGAKHFTHQEIGADPGSVLQKICSIYKIIQPILSVIVNLPIIPPALRIPLKAFMDLLGKLCA